MTTLTFRVPDELAEELENICKEEERSKSWFMKKALIEKIEELRDVRIALKARAEYERNPDSLLSHDEVLSELGISKDELEDLALSKMTDKLDTGKERFISHEEFWKEIEKGKKSK